MEGGGGGGFREPLSINQEDSHDTEVRNSNHGNFLLLLHIFADLIIGEVVGPLSPDHPFCRCTLRCRCPRDDQGNNNWRRLWDPNRKSHL